MSISHTAAFIAVKLYGLTRNSIIAKNFDPFIIRFYEQLLLYLPKHLRWYHSLLKSSFIRSFLLLSEEILLPGDLMHILCRKFYVTRQVLNLLDKGMEQVVNLGGGFDHQGAYLSQRGVSVYEIDRSSMINKKQSFIEKELMANDCLHFVACDVHHQRIIEVLSHHSLFDAKKNTIFIAEGFFDYLDLNRFKNVVEDIKTLNPENKLVSTLFSIDELSFFHRWMFKTGVSMVGETLKFTITRNEFIALLEDLGMGLNNEITATQMEADFAKQLGLNLPVMKGFYIHEFKSN